MVPVLLGRLYARGTQQAGIATTCLSFAEELVRQTTRQVQAVVSLDRLTHRFASLTDRLNNAQANLSEVCDTAQPKSAAKQKEPSSHCQKRGGGRPQGEEAGDS